MKRFIDADKLTDKLEELQFNAPVMTPVMKIYNVIELVEDQPTADVVEVVRCKDCKYNSFEEANGTVHCCIDEYVRDRRKPEDFCSRGERK